MRGTAAALREIRSYQEGELASVLAAADKAVAADDTKDAPLADAPAMRANPEPEVDTDAAAEAAPAPQQTSAKLAFQPVIPEALYMERLLTSEQGRLAGQITETETQIAKLRAEIDERYKALKAAEEDLFDLQRADAICTAGLNKAAEPHPQRT